VSAVTPPEIVKQMADLAIKYDLVVMSDEIYADQMYYPLLPTHSPTTHPPTYLEVSSCCWGYQHVIVLSRKAVAVPDPRCASSLPVCPVCTIAIADWPRRYDGHEHVSIGTMPGMR
jgi:hypothetical protein